jgi:DNA-binding beta-propeller fold protein YncE
MLDNDYLFPRRLTRRDFFRAAGAIGAAALVPSPASAADETKDAVKIGAGKQTYTLDEAWGQLPAGMRYGHGCAVVVDGQDRVFVTSRSNSPCVAIFDKEGKLLETWSKEFAEAAGYEKPDQVTATAHGLYLNKEGDQEFLYWTENVSGSKENRIGARVYKTDLKGKRLYTLGNVAKESPTEQKFDFTNPTDVAVSANGDIYVVDGYGSQRLSRFDKTFKHLKTIGGPGKEHGQFSTCHGIWIRTLGKEPEVYVADRANGRLEVFSLDLEYKRTVTDFRNPCCFYQHDGLLYVPELGARVSILDADDKIVARLGDGQGIKGPDLPKNPDKFGLPHALTVASNGDLYVVEWIDYGRVRKFKHTPSA